MPPLISILALVSILLLQAAAHQCVLRDAPNQPSTTIPDSRINDDYCDCLDASDEYRTAACPNGTFICANTAYRKKTIPSSWVRDGSCDCCDGSDELPDRCPDNCAALLENDMKQAKLRADIIMRGVATRQRYVKSVAAATQNDARELRKLQRELALVERALNKSTARAQGLRKRRDWQPRLPLSEQRDPVTTPKETPSSGAEQHLDDDDDEYHYEDEMMEDEQSKEEAPKDRDSGTQEDDREEDGIYHDEELDDLDDEDFEDDLDDEKYDQHEDENDLEDEEDIDDLIGDIEADPDEPASSNAEAANEPHTEQEDDSALNADEGSQTSEQAHQKESEPEVEPEPTLDVDSICADLETSSLSPIFRIVAYARAVVLAKLHRMFPKIFPVRSGSAISGLDECIRQADSAKWKLQSQKSDIEEKIKKLKEKQTTDYGAHNALRKLHGECVKSKVMQYEFEHCPFDLVRQYEHGSAIATLGRFDGWEVDGNERYMKYTRGDTCWNGPARSIKVQLICGEKEEIVSVDEPNRCTYFMKFRSPAVCEKKMADEIMSAFDTGSEQKEEL